MKKPKTTNALEILDQRYPPTPRDLAQRAIFREQMDIAQMIYDARTAAGLSQRQLAKLVGTTASVICRLEDADYDGHSLTMLRRIADALNKRLELRLVPAAKRQKRVAVPA